MFRCLRVVQPTIRSQLVSLHSQCLNQIRHSSHQAAKQSKVTISTIAKLHSTQSKITMLTAYDYISAKIADSSGVDIVLVGDSLAMASLGYDDTNEIPFDEFLYHCRAVSRGVERAFVVADLPFGSYESSVAQAVESSIALVSKGRANAVKLEGGKEICATVRRLTELGIPVCGHIGLTPQRANALGGFKSQGKSVQNAIRLYEDALALQEAGCFSMVVEAVPSELAELITEKLDVPTIGIGAGPHTSGQVLVQTDMLGFLGPDAHTPKFVKRYADGFGTCVDAVKQYVKDVQEVSFPEMGKNTYKVKEDVLSGFKEYLKSQEK
ncbi:hypothetical protein WICPIJ_009703 [Wickerhamomyces pijperi]|uniref:3-methyl-2-oxobutanoate hydroxymethyltransferase n=1 Tax=Wickerhamomyces pijperi TaxID=599730 RepID=A0A9P8PKK6_WICPI|nr:hypothetical protein WICPIJ_009703 [Wickerhamomyces pijperi]